MSNKTAILISVVSVVLLTAGCLYNVAYENDSKNLDGSLGEIIFSNRSVVLISDGLDDEVKETLAENTNQITVTNTLSDLTDGEIIIIDENWITDGKHQSETNKIKDLFMSGKPVILIPGHSNYSFEIMTDLVEPLGFVTYEKGYQIYGFKNSTESQNIYCYSGNGYAEPLDSLVDAYEWAVDILFNPYDELKSNDDPSCLDVKTISCDKYGRFKAGTFYEQMPAENMASYDYESSYLITNYIQCIPNSYDGYRTSCVSISSENRLLNPTCALSDFFPATYLYSCPVYIQNTHTWESSDKFETYSHTNAAFSSFDSVFNLDKSKIEGVYSPVILAYQLIYIDYTTLYNINTDISVTFCKMNYDILNRERYSDYAEYTLNLSGSIDFDSLDFMNA